MDNVTHTLFALTIARTPLGRAGRGTTAALLLASNAPDIDIVTLTRGPITYLKWHRGPTHGPAGMVGLALASAGLVWIGRRVFDRRRAARHGAAATDHDGTASFGMLVALSLIGVLLHVGMDLPTSYGTRALSPFDWHWFAADLMPIIDIYLLAALVAGLVFGRQSAEARQRNAAIVLALMAAGYGVRAVAHQQAIQLAPRVFGPTLPTRCDGQRSPARRPIDLWPRAQAASSSASKRCLVELAAIPTFTSPFRWQIVARLSNAYELRDLDLLDARWREPDEDSGAPWRTSVRYPDVWTPEVTRAADSHLGQVFLGFSRFPAARSALDAHGVTTVRWTDVRFAAGGVALDQRRPGLDMFTATVRVGGDGQILLERLGR